jgi:hypothetical protein
MNNFYCMNEGYVSTVKCSCQCEYCSLVKTAQPTNASEPTQPEEVQS